ncbi:uncharacterized protein PHALS_10734 [Plasmopara halstedii]|uniref:Uncharacterized protein n=1 Tax=Plasmopara halstedii TaxID=4781 RepID=A0A0P1AH31_PLAHL|nr:uncharacterized protein PHALS_10734 [Plasmopara halstedii]CEG40541.1 hypothetical protein PHALS_10734 [Plasmopara halstedii]|eukprot:XP_024576910.1 hypothetical protein PHALS_10734 [Plasmopara halstedii]
MSEKGNLKVIDLSQRIQKMQTSLPKPEPLSDFSSTTPGRKFSNVGPLEVDIYFVLFSDEMIPDVEKIGSALIFVVTRIGDRALSVTMHNHWTLDLDLHH